jgi:ribosome biogenesis protein Tsr3
LSTLDPPKPIEELAHILSKFGWGTRFSDLSEEQVHTLIFGIQEAKRLAAEIEIGKLEETYYKSTGTWPSTSIPF